MAVLVSPQSQATPNFKPSTAKAEVTNVATVKHAIAPVTSLIAPPETMDSVRVAQLQTMPPSVIMADVHNHWAQGFIEALAARQIIQGFPDGNFRPDAPVTRAQFAAMIQSAFSANRRRAAIAFADVPTNHWAHTAIQDATEMGFLTGYPGHVFGPDRNMPRIEVLVSLVKGLKLSATGKTVKMLKAHFQDAANIPDYARDSVATAIEKRIVYPNAVLKPYKVATRADVAVFIYQALASTGELPPLNSSAIASQ